MPTATLTSKGQVTIPKEIRDRLRLETGQRLEFEIDKNGKLSVVPRNRDFRSLKGIVKSKRKTPVTVEEMNQAIIEGFSRI
ncbi:MAG TPA: AbrB/MazE/SpoVT family DNA-binding domain-containing protein [Bryobacteraceae bacterium]|nr:AbrB/MazE/SpoVT family DNA-binding domain-containing protein [Bryobacteraceae bacterium]